ncbi:DNA cytosine methyltransferase [Sphingobium sufflavum]|uniref:DNA cytosine methyltransferase n=1 Tax=Sphingobium sufflavum TaxID=1129547 RepID=UPI001F471F7A|nr:DNA cytosine methyltransferase [Sphingobium sufflavum]MCE7797832.1 DNA cytosine methyltransferase [Sphingobium sufflavum]
MKLFEGLFIDGFAGGGGASTGIAQAIGRDVDHAINHSETAIAIHRANHPGAEHHCTDIRIPMLPQTVTRGLPVAGAWFSPDCKEFSKAKGGPVKDRSIRALCWEVVAWLKDVRPERGYLENVEEFEYAAPLDEGGNPIKGQEGREFKRFVKAIRALGYRVAWKILRACDYGAPTSRKRLYMVMSRDKGPIFWPKPTHGAPNSPGVRSGKLLPYLTAASCIDWSIPCPSIFGRARELAEATKRRIAHGVMRYVVNAARPFIVGSDRAPHITKFRNGSIGSDMALPMPTVTANGEPKRPAGATPLGIVDTVLAPHIMTNRNSQKPFNGADEPTHTITAGGAHLNAVQASLVTYGQHGGRNRPVDEPHHTVAASKKDTNGVIGATLVGVGGRRGQSPPMAVDGVYPTTTTKADAAVATAFLSHFYTSNTNGGEGDPEAPVKAITAGGQHHAVVTAHLEQANGGPRNKNSAGRSAERPLSTATTTGSQQRIVQTTMIANDDLPPELMDRAVQTAAFLVKYYGTDSENEAAQIQPVDRPLDTVTTKARFAVVTVTIDAVTYVIVDIGLRMLKPRELARAQGFPDDYVLDPIVRKYLRGKWVERPLTIAEQISAIGNSVCPPVARALVAANQPGLPEMRRAA